MPKQTSIASILFFFIGCLVCLAVEDEIDFMNVGQGHAVLVNRVGLSDLPHPLPWAPLLIDAGSTKRPDIATKNYTWDQDESVAVQKISKRIVDFWQRSNNNLLPGGTYHLNIIITHPDKDHKELVPLILAVLEERKTKIGFAFSVFILLGGTPEMYNGFLNDPRYIKEYSSNCSGLFFSGTAFTEKFPPLNRSSCITHLFCPRGIPSDDNRWSIITRVEINGISAILTGDADQMVKRQMLKLFNPEQHPITELESDILMVPHHGAEKTFYADWDQAVNPKAIVIGSGPRQDYQHPRGRTILQLINLLSGKGRIWEDRVLPHGCQYSGDVSIHQQIQAAFESNGKRLFSCVPYNIMEDQQQPVMEQWHLVWIDLPIYTLWTTGTLYFQGTAKASHFVDAPGGMMPYVAVSDPLDLLNPEIRQLSVPLTPKERDLCQQISKIIQEKYMGSAQNRIVIENSIISEVLPMRVSDDREIYFKIISTLLSQGEFLYFSPLFLKWVKEAVIDRNKNVSLSAQRLQNAATFMVPLREDEVAQLDDPRGTWNWEWNPSVFQLNISSNLDGNSLILKTFSKSLCSIEHLKNYIEVYFTIANRGVLNEDLEVLCPFGFPDWLQLRRLVNFFYDITVLDDNISIIDFIDIKNLRIQGKSFKEIAIDIMGKYIEFVDKGIFKGSIYIPTTKAGKTSDEENNIVGHKDQKEVQSLPSILEIKLKEYFPDTLDLL